MNACERCGVLSTRRNRCAICNRLICRDCMERPRQRDEVRWCAAFDGAGVPMPDDCKEPEVTQQQQHKEKQHAHD